MGWAAVAANPSSSYATGRQLAGSYAASYGGAPPSSTTTDSFLDMRLIHAHGVCMFGAFGVLLPAGAFLAYTGYHRLHVYIQLSGIALSVAGFGLAAAHVGWDRSFTQAHHWLGLIVLLLALVAQPWAICKDWRRFHHRNGSAVILLGLVNNALGIADLGLGRAFVFMYTFIVALQLVFVVFDPLNMRSARMISEAQKKQAGESTVIELSKLLSAKKPERAANKAQQRRQRQRQQAAVLRQGMATLRQRRVQPAAEADGADDGDGGVLTDDDGAAGEPEEEEELPHAGWRCALRDGGARVVFTAPTK